MGGPGLSQRLAIGAGDAVVVLGRMAARVVARPRAGVAYRLLAWREGPPQGRRRPAGSALLDVDGGVLAARRRRRAGGRPHRLGDHHQAGCRSFNLIPSAAEAVAGVARVKALLGAQA